MTRLKVEKLHVDMKLKPEQTLPRRYTLTHSDFTGDLFLTVASIFNKKQISGLYTRFMRDEILAEWLNTNGKMSLHVYCHVEGGIIFGNSSMRESIFRREMPLVLEAIRYGDYNFFQHNKDLDNASIIVHFRKSRKDEKIEEFGSPAHYSILTE
jgi:hypothetical protein